MVLNALKNGAGLKVKVCGITNPEDALLCINEGADALGFIFAGTSPRYITPGGAAEITEQLPPLVMKIGVFVDEDPEKINAIALQANLNAVQLHGNESPGIAKQINLPVIKAFRVKSDFDFSILRNYKGVHFLLDSYSPDRHGGTGTTFDWDTIPLGYRNSIILAGGVTAANAVEIYYKIYPAAVDVSSSLEIFPGRKDEAKVKEFFKVLKKIRNR